MTSTIRPRRRKAAAGGDILEQLKRRIADGEFPPGSVLPPERELAASLGVSRPSLREALRGLVEIGALETRHGSGTRVAATSANVLASSFEFLLLLDRPALDDLIEARELIEAHLAARAAERRDGRDLVEIGAAVAALRAAPPLGEAWVEANRRFHLAVAAASRTTILARFMSCLDDGLRASIEAGQRPTTDAAEAIAAHQAIAQAIADGDPGAAAAAVRAHMRLTRANAGEARRLAVRGRAARRRRCRPMARPAGRAITTASFRFSCHCRRAPTSLRAPGRRRRSCYESRTPGIRRPASPAC